MLFSFLLALILIKTRNMKPFIAIKKRGKNKLLIGVLV